MQKILIASLLILLFSACTLSGTQEEKLNRQLGKYIAAHNDNRILQYAGLTHPAVVRYYHDQGDSLFIEHFNNPDSIRQYFNDPIYVETKSDNNVVQRKYKVENSSYKENSSSSFHIFALSDDGGDTWFFLCEKDYLDKRIKGYKRLFN